MHGDNIKNLIKMPFWIFIYLSFSYTATYFNLLVCMRKLQGKSDRAFYNLIYYIPTQNKRNLFWRTITLIYVNTIKKLEKLG